MFKFLINFGKKNSKKNLPTDLQIKIMSGNFDTQQVKEIISAYNLSAEESNIIANGFRMKKDFKLAAKYYNDSLKKDKTNGDVYGNLISFYCEQKKYGLCEKIFKLGLTEAIQGREFIYYHQGRAWFNQGRYDLAATTGMNGMQEAKEEHYEPLFVLCIQSWINVALLGRKLNIPDEEVKGFFETAAKVAHLAYSLFPNSEEIKTLYDDLIETEK